MPKKNGRGNKPDAPPAPPVTKLAYSREGMDPTENYNPGDTMSIFYNFMSRKLGIPVREVSYDDIKRLAPRGKILPGGYVAGLHFPGKDGKILISESDDRGRKISKRGKV